MIESRRPPWLLWIGLITLAILFLVIGVIVAVNRKPSVDVTNAPSGNQNPLEGAQFYVDPQSRAALQANAWRESQPDNAKKMDRLAALPTAYWVNGAEMMNGLPAYVTAAAQAKAVPVLVLYNIPKRDCGKYSSGGATDAKAYSDFVDQMATAIGDNKAVVIVEPDALAAINERDSIGQPCLTAVDRDMYFRLIGGAVTTLKARPNTHVYIDAGNSSWVTDTAEMAARLERANVAAADGFSLNVSNFETIAATVKYGKDIASHSKDAHFVIDTSRNGLGPYDNPANADQNWCNPPGRALGHFPTTATGEPGVDAFLYIKTPGESDGSDPDPNKCFGGPAAGEWWPDYALGLIDRWPQDLQPNP